MEDPDRIRLARPSDKPQLVDLWLRLSADGHSADARYSLDHRAVSFWRSVGFGDWRVTLALRLD